MIFWVILLLFVVGLGAVAVQNFLGEKTLADIELFPEQFTPAASPSTELTPTKAVEAGPDWRVFDSNDRSFRLRYPPDWRLFETMSSRQNSRGVFGVTVQSWGLTNSQDEVSTETVLTEKMVKIEFEILTEGRKQSLENLLNCEIPNSSKCEDVLINGVSYKKLVTQSPEGIENIVLATVKDDRIYRITGQVNPESNQEGEQQLKEIINSFEIIQKS